MVREQPRASVLIVDDDLDSAYVLSRIFEDEYDVTVCGSGEEGLLLARHTNPSVILLDVLMPGMDGFEVCSRLKANPDTSDLPIILMTGLDGSEAETRGLSMGAVDYVTKPIVPQVIERRVRNQVELSQARERLLALATTDGLTGVKNRRFFDETLAREYARLARTGGVLSLILLDIDHFKAFNDKNGHMAGDDALRHIAAAMEATLHRPADIVARFGGEEFACILPETDAEGAMSAARRIQGAIADLRLPHPESSVSGFVTASLGVATERCSPGQSELNLIACADQQLYIAKERRNQICATYCKGAQRHH